MDRFARMLVAALAALVLVPVESPADPLQDCAEAASPEEFSACLARRQRVAMRRLEEAREALLARVSADEARALLAEAEAAFDAYVEAGCRARSHLVTGHVPAEDLRRDCIIRLIEQRSDELEATAERLAED